MIAIANLPSRKAVMDAIGRERNKQVSREQAILIICKRRGWRLNDVRAIAAHRKNGRPAKKPQAPKKPEPCECGATESIQRRYGKWLCPDCQSKYAKDRKPDPTPEEVAERCAAIRQARPRDPQGYRYYPVEIEPLEFGRLD